jgi:hypothetical protein
MKKFLKIIVLVVSIIAVLLAGAYLYIRFMPDKSITKHAADYTLSASNLAEEYESNLTGSDRKFIDRLIVVKGVISEITTDQNNSVVFILRDNSSSTGVLCTLNEKVTKEAKRYKVGDTVTIKGICSGMLFEVVLNKCMIVD